MNKKITTMFGVSNIDVGKWLQYVYSEIGDTQIIESDKNDGLLIPKDNIELNNAIKIIEDFINLQLNPPEITGEITIQFLDESTNTLLESATVLKNQSLGNHTFQAKDYNSNGYILDGNEYQTITLTESNTSAIITFNYKKVESK